MRKLCMIIAREPNSDERAIVYRHRSFTRSHGARPFERMGRTPRR